MSFVVDPREARVLRRLGNLTAAATAEVLVAARAYVEQSSQAQRSVQSTSVQDKPSGSGAHRVLITYLTSAYELKTEEVILNGTTNVNTVGTDIRFVERFEVSKGAAAAGAIKLMDGTGGGAAEFCGIGVGTYDAFLCHHYVPAGKKAWVIGWGATVDDEVKFKLLGRAKPNGTDLVDQHIDLVNLMGIATPPGFLQFGIDLIGTIQLAGSYVRVNAVPNQATTTVVRSCLCLWEEPA